MKPQSLCSRVYYIVAAFSKILYFERIRRNAFLHKIVRRWLMTDNDILQFCFIKTYCGMPKIPLTAPLGA